MTIYVGDQDPDLQRRQLMQLGKGIGDVWQARRDRRQRDTAAEIALIMNAYKNNQYVNPAQIEQVKTAAGKHMSKAQIALLSDSLNFAGGESQKGSDATAKIEELLFTQREQAKAAGRQQGTAGQQLLSAIGALPPEMLRYMSPEHQEIYKGQIPKLGPGSSGATDLLAGGGTMAQVKQLADLGSGAAPSVEGQSLIDYRAATVAQGQQEQDRRDLLQPVQKELVKAQTANASAHAAYYNAQAEGGAGGGIIPMHPTHHTIATDLALEAFTTIEKENGEFLSPEEIRMLLAKFEAALGLRYSQMLTQPNMTESEAARRAAEIALSTAGITPEMFNPVWDARIKASKRADDKFNAENTIGEEVGGAPSSVQNVEALARAAQSGRRTGE